jgi:hypothetical protein
MRQVTNRRQLIGAIVDGEIGRRGWKKNQAAANLHIGRNTIYRLVDGAPNVRAVNFRMAEAALDLPRHLFDHVLDGDAVAIEALDFDADLKRIIIEGLRRLDESEVKKVPTRRRKEA